MSLPHATKDISTHPVRGSVTDPVNQAEKDADVDRKLRLYGVIQAFRDGKLPSNAQINSTLQHLLGHSPVNDSQLSPEGRKLVDDIRRIISTSQDIISEKNADELVQDFMWRSMDVASHNDEQGLMKKLGHKAPVRQGEANHDKDIAVKHLRTILTLVLTNGEVRKLASDFSIIGRDLLAKGATHAVSSRVAPPKERLDHVNEPAPEDQFFTEGGRTAEPGETPIFEGHLPGTHRRFRQKPREDDAQIINPDGSRKPIHEGYHQAKGMKENLQSKRGSEMLGQAKNEMTENIRDVSEADDASTSVSAKKQGIKGKMRQVRDNINGHTQKQQESSRGKVEKGRRYLSDEYFPQERRDQFIFRLKKVIVECQKHEDYQRSMTWILDFIKSYAQQGKGVSHAGTESSQTPGLSYSLAELRTILERFANGRSMQVMTDALDVLIDDSKRDPALRKWFSAAELFARKVLLEPGYVLDSECDNHADRLRDMGRQFYDGQYKGDFDNLFTSINSWGSGLGEDPLNQQFGEDWARLTKDLLYDNEGGLKFKPELWDDIRRVILPALIENIGYIPVPRVEYSDDSLDLVLENLTLSGRNLLPNIVYFEAQNFIKFSPYNSIHDNNYRRVKIGLDQIQADMRDVAFYYRKKTGMPKMKDSGIADVILGGGGLSTHIELTSSRDPKSVFKISKINVKVHDLKFSIRESSHDFLYKTLRPLATGLIKRRIQHSIRDSLITAFEYLDGQLVGVRDKMASAKDSDKEGGIGTIKDTLGKSQAKKEEAASTTHQKMSSMRSGDFSSPHAQFKVMSDKHDTIFSGQGHPGGWSNKIEQQHVKAGKGREWRSDAFHIVEGPNATAGMSAAPRQRD